MQTDITRALSVGKNNVMKKSNRWTWNSIGYGDQIIKADFVIYGLQAPKIREVM